jgi:hypothetical protein
VNRSNRSILSFVAVSTLATLFALHRIRPGQIDYERARGGRSLDALDRAFR